MVRLSTTAVALIEESRRSQGIPESVGVRIFTEALEDGVKICLAFVNDPRKDDQYLEEHGTQFYVAQEMTQPLKDTVIDVTEQDPPRLVIRRQEPTT
jgi:Fe-S cluster assembly iron-binding protein IscA